MTTDRKNKRATAKPGMPMRELMAASGLPRSTILYYVDQGLLPAPVKTSPNMAYYAPECEERLRLIKSLQADYRLPLERIKAALTLMDQGVDTRPFLELHRAIFAGSQGELLSAEELCRQSGLKPAQLAQLLRTKLLLPMQEGGFDQEDLAMARLYAGSLAMGLRIEDLDYYPRLGAEIVEQELGLRRRMTGGLEARQDAEVTVRLVRAARALRGYVIDRLFQLRIAAMQSLKG
jgi:DNA-binding transcriptional MerR regulator